MQHLDDLFLMLSGLAIGTGSLLICGGMLYAIEKLRDAHQRARQGLGKGPRNIHTIRLGKMPKGYRYD